MAACASSMMAWAMTTFSVRKNFKVSCTASSWVLLMRPWASFLMSTLRLFVRGCGTKSNVPSDICWPTPALRKLSTACGINDHFAKEVPTPKELSAILEGVRGTAYEQIINVGMLRCMSKAVYEEKPKGHYGLVLQDYAHFTSPIRRYPDLAIHRIMTAQLKGTDKDTMILRYSEFAEDVSKQASEREVIAMQIERKAEDCYKAEYARRHLGECYEGRISGVTQRGLFIELENGVEGFVPASSLTATGTMLTEGVRLSDPVSGKNWNLGDTMMITIVRADVNLGKIDFEVAPESAKQ